MSFLKFYKNSSSSSSENNVMEFSNISEVERIWKNIKYNILYLENEQNKLNVA